MRENFVINPKYSHLLPALKDALLRFDEVGEYVTKGERNVIKKIELNGIYYNIKKFKTPNFFQSIVYQFFRKSKASRSFEYASKLSDLGIGTPKPVAYLELFSFGLKESFYVSEHLNYDFDFRVLIHKPKFENREEILKQFAQFTFKLHENGINFLDHSPGNTLITDNGENKYNFYLIDLNRMSFETMGFEKRMHNFRRLWLSKTMVKIMAAEYAKFYSEDASKTYETMLKYSRAFQKKVNSKKLRKRNKPFS
jgi:tRNA A-37 threonylcarbamoyl transferase component Bud32